MGDEVIRNGLRDRIPPHSCANLSRPHKNRCTNHAICSRQRDRDNANRNSNTIWSPKTVLFQFSRSKSRSHSSNPDLRLERKIFCAAKKTTMPIRKPATKIRCEKTKSSVKIVQKNQWEHSKTKSSVKISDKNPRLGLPYENDNCYCLFMRLLETL